LSVLAERFLIALPSSCSLQLCVALLCRYGRVVVVLILIAKADGLAPKGITDLVVGNA
jgi:hypothetical protein